MENEVFFGQSFILEGVVDVFEKIFKRGHKVHFLNLYNGVKVECFGSVESIENDSVVCKVDLMQILAMKDERNAFVVKDEYFPQNLKADIVGFDIQNLTVTLKNFIYMHNLHANLRKFQRVHPNKFTKVILKGERHEILGNLYDISEGGIGIVSTECGAFGNGNMVTAIFELENLATKEKIFIEIKLKLIAELAYRGAVRYCCQIVDEQPIQKVVTSFANQRVKETLSELEAQINLYR